MTKNINLYIYINITVSSCLETFLYFLVCKLNELISLNEKYLNCPVQITSKLGLFFFFRGLRFMQLKEASLTCEVHKKSIMIYTLSSLNVEVNQYL